MNVELSEQKCYSPKVGDVTLKGLFVVSEWNGLTELRNSEGGMVVVSMVPGSPLSAALNDVLGVKSTIDATVVACSPDMVGVLRGDKKPR